MADRSVNVKLKADVAQYMAAMRAAGGATREIEAAAREVRKAHDEEADAAGRVRLAEAQLAKLRADSKTTTFQLVQAEEQLAAAHRRHETAVERTTVATARFEQAQKSAATEAEKSSRRVEDSMSRMAKRTNAQFDALKFTALTVGLPAAAAVGALAVAGSTALIAAGFAGIGVAAVAQTREVQASFNDLRTSVVDDVKAISLPLRGEVVGAIDDVNAAWERMRPAVAAGIQGSAPAIRELTGAATDLAENAMPGLVDSVDHLKPALQGLRTFTGQVGAGFGEFARNASQGAEGASEKMEIFGGTVRTLEARFGSLMANLANGSNGPLRSLDVVVDQVTGGLLDLTAQGSGAMGTLEGFASAGSGAVTVARGLLSGISALPPELTQLVGSVGASGMILSRFGVDAGAGFQGFRDKVKGAEAGTERFKAVVGGLASGAVHPATLAITALGVGLSYLGQKQEEAAEKTARHAENVRGLTDALRKDQGVIGQHTQSWNAEALASKNAASNLSVFGASMGLAKNAIEGNVGAYKQLQTAANSRIAQLGQEMGLSQNAIGALQGITGSLLENGGAYKDVKGAVDQYTRTTDANGVAVSKMSESQRAAFDAIFNGVGAVGEQTRALREAERAYITSEHALTGLSEAQIRARDATTQHTMAIFDQINASLGHRGAVLNVQQAMKDLEKVNKDGKATSLDRQQAELKLEQAMMQQVAAAGKAAAAANQDKTAKEQEAISTAAMNAEVVKLAGSFSGPLPASLQQAIGKMTATEARAAGLKLGVNNLGQAVYQLPNGKYILIESNADQQAARMQALRDKINAIPTNKKSTVEIVTIYKQVGTAATRTGINAPDVYLYGPHSADGGLVAKSPIRKFAGGGITDIRGGGRLRGGGTPRSDSIMALSTTGPIALSTGEYIIQEEEVGPALPLLDFINAGGLRRYAGGGLVGEAKDALSKIRAGGRFFEAFSDSAGMPSYVDRPDGSSEKRLQSSWSMDSVARQPRLSLVQQAIQAGTVVTQAPTYVVSQVSGAASADGGEFTGNLYLDNGQFLGMVRGEIRKDKRDTRRSVATRAGVAR
ncbi:hypothetical protein ACIBCH_09920 [Amycolatopsis thailandensis]|uniref:hypothetical protein n=1 Tax=Amycolatopsis thailandensis TaxID=589330 RepID=UPI0037B04870